MINKKDKNDYKKDNLGILYTKKYIRLFSLPTLYTCILAEFVIAVSPESKGMIIISLQ